MKGLHATHMWLDELNEPTTMADIAALQRILNRRRQELFDEYRQDLIDFMAYRKSLIARHELA